MAQLITLANFTIKRKNYPKKNLTEKQLLEAKQLFENGEELRFIAKQFNIGLYRMAEILTELGCTKHSTANLYGKARRKEMENKKSNEFFDVNAKSNWL